MSDPALLKSILSVLETTPSPALASALARRDSDRQRLLQTVPERHRGQGTASGSQACERELSLRILGIPPQDTGLRGTARIISGEVTKDVIAHTYAANGLVVARAVDGVNTGLGTYAATGRPVANSRIVDPTGTVGRWQYLIRLYPGGPQAILLIKAIHPWMVDKLTATRSGDQPYPVPRDVTQLAHYLHGGTVTTGLLEYASGEYLGLTIRYVITLDTGADEIYATVVSADLKRCEEYYGKAIKRTRAGDLTLPLTATLKQAGEHYQAAVTALDNGQLGTPITDKDERDKNWMCRCCGHRSICDRYDEGTVTNPELQRQAAQLDAQYPTRVHPTS